MKRIGRKADDPNNPMLYNLIEHSSLLKSLGHSKRDWWKFSDSLDKSGEFMNNLIWEWMEDVVLRRLINEKNQV